MNQSEAGFCQTCHALVELASLVSIPDHGDACPGRFHAPATLTHGPGWISWTIAANSYARSVLIQPIDHETLTRFQRLQREN